MPAIIHNVFSGLLQWLSALVIAAPLAAGYAAAADAPKPAPPGSISSTVEVKPAEPPVKPTPEVIALLDRLEKQSKETKTLQATVRYDLNQLLQNDEQKRFGKLVYEAGPPARFAVHFDSLKLGKAAVPNNRWYIFDGKWLVEKLADKKQFSKWQVVAPDAKPQDADPLGLGRGPFVVPVALRKALVLSKFAVELPAFDEKKDPQNSVHLRLKPLKGQRIDFTEIDLWYDKDTLLPLRTRTINASETESIIHVSDLKLNEKVDPKLLDTAEPKEPGWKVEVTPWEAPAAK